MARLEEIEQDQMSANDVKKIAQEQLDAINNYGVTPVPGGGSFVIPLASGVVTCEFMCYGGHTGIDLSSSNKTQAVLAAAGGTVVVAGWHNSYGNYVIISHNLDGQQYTTLYAHMSSLAVSKGQQVGSGQFIGNMGSTGNSTGAHLHFEIYVGGYNYPNASNPRQFINFPGSW